MGYAARVNPVSLDAADDPQAVKKARIKRFVEQFETREAFDAFLAVNAEALSDKERALLEELWAQTAH